MGLVVQILPKFDFPRPSYILYHHRDKQRVLPIYKSFHLVSMKDKVEVR